MRESWIYAVAFLLILGGGAALLVPLVLQGPDGTEPAEPSPTPAPPSGEGVDMPEDLGPEPVATFTGLVPPEDLALPGAASFVLDLAAPATPEVFGATLGLEAGTAAASPRVTVTPESHEVFVGAPGHVWRALSAGALPDGKRLGLVPAGPPLIVLVTESDGTPAADVPVRVYPPLPGPLPRTDAAGRLRLDRMPKGLVALDADTSERRGTRLRVRNDRPRQVRLVLEPAWTIRGRALGPDGQPAPGTRIRVLGPRGLLGRPVTVDEDGRFAWRGPAESVAAVRLSHPTLAERALRAQPRAREAAVTDLGDVQFRSAGVTVDCEIVSELPGASPTVTIEPEVAATMRELFGRGQALDVPRVAQRDGRGHYVLEGLPVDLPLRVRVRGAGIPMDTLVMGGADELLSVPVAPVAGYTLAGVIQDSDGTPLPSVRVIVSAEPRDGTQVLPGDLVAYTGVSGAFQLTGLERRTWFVRAYRVGRRSLLRRVQLPLEAAVPLRFENAIPDDTRRIRGVVRARDGTRLPDVTVRAAGVETRTDKQGAFCLDGVESLAPVVTLAFGYEPGACETGAVDPATFVARQTIDVTPGANAELVLMLPRAGHMRFRMTDIADGAPVRYAHVLVRSPTGAILFDRGVSARDGHVELAGFPRPTVQVAVLTHGLRAERVVVLRDQSEDVTLDVPLSRGMWIEGTVRAKPASSAGTAQVGVPLPGVRISGLDAGWQHRSTDPVLEREVLFRQATTDESGRFTLRGFNPKKAAVLGIWAQGRAPIAQQVLLPGFSDDTRAEVDVSLSKGAYLLAILQDEVTRRPVTGANIDLEHGREGSDYLDLIHRAALGGPVASTDEWATASRLLLFEEPQTGNYIVGPLVPGPYEMWIERPGYAGLRRNLTVLGRGQTVGDMSLRATDPVIGGGTRLIPLRSILGDTTRLIFLMEPID